MAWTPESDADLLACVHRRPRRLGGGKGGESREPKAPKDPSKRGLPAALPSIAALPPPPSADRDRDR